MANYKNLIAWQKANLLAVSVYKITANFPRTEFFGITSQLRRASLSVPMNIVEGYARKSKKEFVRFLDISLGSLAETEYLLDFSVEMGFMKEEDSNKIKCLIEETGKLSWSLQKSKLLKP